MPPSASHPSLPAPYQNGHGAGYDVHGLPLQEWGIPHAAQLEGPGMPVARSASIHSTAPSAVPVAAGAAAEGDAGDAGDGDNDNDDRTYCFCDGISYGEMIACDDTSCEREWVRVLSLFAFFIISSCSFLFQFHLACIGLTVPPEGTWYCEACKNKKPAKRTVRGGKRRTAASKA